MTPNPHNTKFPLVPGAVLRALRAHYGSVEAARLAVNAEWRAGRERWIVAAERLVKKLSLPTEE